MNFEADKFAKMLIPMGGVGESGVLTAFEVMLDFLVGAFQEPVSRPLAPPSCRPWQLGVWSFRSF